MDEIKRGRGRPKIGGRIIVTLTDEQRATAERLGSGVISAGVQLALDMAGAAERRRIARKPREATDVPASR